MDFESGGLKDFGKSDMKGGGNFGFINVESFSTEFIFIFIEFFNL